MSKRGYEYLQGQEQIDATARIAVRVPADLEEKILKKTLELGVSKSRFIRDAIEYYLTVV